MRTLKFKTQDFVLPSIIILKGDSQEIFKMSELTKCPNHKSEMRPFDLFEVTTFCFKSLLRGLRTGTVGYGLVSEFNVTENHNESPFQGD